MRSDAVLVLSSSSTEEVPLPFSSTTTCFFCTKKKAILNKIDKGNFLAV
jgi:hypothetical protein